MNTLAEQSKRGGISVEAEHIFPIIKKWLYSDKEIFLREIVSNAVDAATKIKRLVSLGEIKDIDTADLKVTVSLDSELGTITVSDNGIGIKECELSRIFDKTYRVMSSGVSREGTGLGLYYVKENVEKMKGKINVNSSFGNGSEFRITLPIVK